MVMVMVMFMHSFHFAFFLSLPFCVNFTAPEGGKARVKMVAIEEPQHSKVCSWVIVRCLSLLAMVLINLISVLGANIRACLGSTPPRICLDTVIA